MSHLVTIRTQVRDLEAVRTACRKLGLKEPTQGKTQFFQKEVEGTIVQLPFWQFPVVIDLTTGILHYDNWQGRWGNQEDLHRFTQRYAVEKSILEGRRQGHSVQEQSLPDGSVRLLFQVAGA